MVRLQACVVPLGHNLVVLLLCCKHYVPDLHSCKLMYICIDFWGFFVSIGHVSVLSGHVAHYQGLCLFGFWFVILDNDAMKMSPDKCLLRFYPQGNFI